MADKPHKQRLPATEIVNQGQVFWVTDFQVGYAWDRANGTYPTIKLYDGDNTIIVALRPEAIPVLIEDLPKWAPTITDEGTKQ